MKKIFSALLLTIFLFPAIIYAEDTFEGFASRVESWAEGLNGYVVSNTGATIDLGKNANVVKGMQFSTNRDGEKLIHPVTGESLGVKKVITGKIVVSSTEQKYSTTKILENKGIKKGDKVEHIFPVPINFKTNLLQESETAQIKYALFKSSAVKEDSSSDYSIICERQNSGANTAKCSLNFKGSVIFSDNIPVKGVKIISTKKTSHNNLYKIDNQVASLSVGFFLGKEKEYLVATTDKSSVTLYTVAADKLVEKYSLSSFRGEISNIESYDINNNGKDELIVSIIDKKNNVISQVYEFDGKKFQLIEDKIPYLFRSYFAKGKKHLICQSYSEGTMVGLIYNVVYDKINEEIKYEPEDLSFGASIYGYGVLDDNFIYFNRHGLLSKSYKSNNISYHNINFGNTVNYIIFSQKLSTGVNVGETGESAGFFVYDEQNIVVPVYQRIIQTKDGSLFMSSNELAKNNIMGSFKNSFIGTYFLTNDSVVTSYQTQIDGTAVTDIDITPDGSTIIYIYSKNKNGLDDVYLDVITNDSF